MLFSHHLSDEVLLLVGDGEVSPRRLVRAERHLSVCEVCRARLVRLEETLAAALDAQRSPARPLPPAQPARARLARWMAAESAGRTRPFRGWMPDRRWLYAAAIVLLAAASGLVLDGQRGPRAAMTAVFLLPRAELTPGAAAPVTPQDLCGVDRQPRTQPIPGIVHQAIFARYGADYRRAAEYELDYLITPELGGVADPRNLWPQPFARTPWNAYVKDELERWLHQRVC